MTFAQCLVGGMAPLTRGLRGAGPNRTGQSLGAAQGRHQGPTQYVVGALGNDGKVKCEATVDGAA